MTWHLEQKLFEEQLTHAVCSSPTHSRILSRFAAAKIQQELGRRALKRCSGARSAKCCSKATPNCCLSRKQKSVPSSTGTNCRWANSGISRRYDQKPFLSAQIWERDRQLIGN